MLCHGVQVLRSTGQPRGRAHAPEPNAGFPGRERRNFSFATDAGKIANIPKVLETRPVRELYNALSLSPEKCLFISRKDFKN